VFGNLKAAGWQSFEISKSGGWEVHVLVREEMQAGCHIDSTSPLTKTNHFDGVVSSGSTSKDCAEGLPDSEGGRAHRAIGVVGGVVTSTPSRFFRC